MEVVRFQEASNAIDAIAADVLAVDRRQLACLTFLCFAGPAHPPALSGALGWALHDVRDAVASLEAAGYVRRQVTPGRPVELTDHARDWIARIWEPLRTRGEEAFSTCSPKERQVIARYLDIASGIQERYANELRALLAEPRAPRGHRRGGLSPAALRRVELLVDSRIAEPLRLDELAGRAGLSRSHFSRAFRLSMGMTPRAYVEARRVLRAKALLERGEQGIAHIAAATGFSTQSKLTTAFRRAVGVTPAVYRRRFR